MHRLQFITASAGFRWPSRELADKARFPFLVIRRDMLRTMRYLTASLCAAFILLKPSVTNAC